MKCLSLWQPWATLVAIGAKKIETRSWPTSYRGPLAIHAALKWDWSLFTECINEPFESALEGHRLLSLQPLTRAVPKILPLGQILAVVNLDDCVEITSENAPDEPERSFGDYTPGRFAWHMSNVRRCIQPVPFSGRQQLFDVPEALIKTGTIQDCLRAVHAAGGKAWDDVEDPERLIAEMRGGA